MCHHSRYYLSQTHWAGRIEHESCWLYRIRLRRHRRTKLLHLIYRGHRLHHQRFHHSRCLSHHKFQRYPENGLHRHPRNHPFTDESFWWFAAWAMVDSSPNPSSSVSMYQTVSRLKLHCCRRNLHRYLRNPLVECRHWSLKYLISVLIVVNVPNGCRCGVEFAIFIIG